MSLLSYVSRRGSVFFIASVACLVALGLPSMEAHAERDTGFRVSVQGGFTSNASVNLRKNGNNTLKSSDETSPAFGAAFYYGFEQIDVGLAIEHVGSGSFQGFSKNRPLGGKVRVAGVLNWHYISGLWGTMYLGFSPGVVFIQHNDHLRSQIATALGRLPTQLDGIDKYNEGFSFGTTFGLFFNVTDDFALVFEGQILVNDVRLQEESDDLNYLSTQPVFRMGFAAQL